MKIQLVPVLLALFIAACETGQSSALPLVGTLERDRIELVAEANEAITEIFVAEGDAVHAGQLLMRLDNTLQQTEINIVQAIRDRAAQRLAELVRGPRQEQIREAQARLKGARDHLAIQNNEFQRLTELYERNLGSKSAVEHARNSLENAIAQVGQYAAIHDALLVGTTKEELAQAEAALAEAQARVDYAVIIGQRYTVTAPRDGRIEALPYKSGERPPARAAVVIMLANQAPYARVYIPEPMRASLRPGLLATIRVDGIDIIYNGSLRYISADAAFTPYYSLTQRDRSRLAFLAEIQLNDAAARELPTGVPVQVAFPSLQ